MDEGHFTLRWNYHKSTFLGVLANLKDNNQFSDVTLACDGELFPAHQLVLSTCSEYFATMLENTQHKSPIIVLTNVNKEHLKALLQYMYLGEVQFAKEELHGLISVAESLRIRGLIMANAQDVLGPNESPPSTTKLESDNSDGSTTNKPRIKKKNQTNTKLSTKEEASKISPSPTHELEKDRMHDMVIVKTESEAESGDEDDDDDTMNEVEENSTDPLINQLAGPSDMDGLWENNCDEILPHTIFVPERSFFNQDNALNEKDEKNKKKLEELEKILSSKKPVQNYNCPFCPYKTKKSSHIKRHVRIHTGNKPFPCNLCDYRGNDRGALNRHSRTHTGEKPYECNYCSYSAIDTNTLTRHVRRRHTGSKPYFCNLCNYKSIEKRSLNHHMSTKHKL